MLAPGSSSHDHSICCTTACGGLCGALFAVFRFEPRVPDALPPTLSSNRGATVSRTRLLFGHRSADRLRRRPRTTGRAARRCARDDPPGRSCGPGIKRSHANGPRARFARHKP
jgi:hypothetical protein